VQHKSPLNKKAHPNSSLLKKVGLTIYIRISKWVRKKTKAYIDGKEASFVYPVFSFL
jgi:hypothetical protein